MIRAGVIGATGYTGQELVEVLLGHPGVELTYIAARADKGARYSDIFPRFKGKTDLVCLEPDADACSRRCDAVFLTLPHTASFEVAPDFLKKGMKLIDLSADYRLPAGTYEEWYGKEHTDKQNIDKAVYGLPELNRDRIRKTAFVSNPGCYPTSVILGLLPVIELVCGAAATIIVDSKSGTTGAGKKESLAFSFSEVDENFKSYKANEHQHIPEMEHVLSGAAGRDVKVHFTPHLLPIRRGILSTIYISHGGLPPADELHALYSERYRDEPFVRVRDIGDMPEIRYVAGTNFCDIGIKVARGMLIVISAIDNLLKGAGGQAVQNMNIMMGLDERSGLL